MNLNPFFVSIMLKTGFTFSHDAFIRVKECTSLKGKKKLKASGRRGITHECNFYRSDSENKQQQNEDHTTYSKVYAQ